MECQHNPVDGKASGEKSGRGSENKSRKCAWRIQCPEGEVKNRGVTSVNIMLSMGRYPVYTVPWNPRK